MSGGPYIRIRLDIEYRGADIHAFGGWPAYRELMNAVVRALAAMDGGPSEAEVVPAALAPGSLVNEVLVPEHTLPAIQRFRKGPAAGDWSQREIDGAAPFHEWMRARDAKARLHVPGVEQAFPVNVPSKTAPARGDVRQWETLRANVFRVGGRDRVVELRFDLDGVLLKCDLEAADDAAAAEFAARMGACLYSDVIAEGRGRRSADGRLLAFTVTRFERAPVKDGRSLRDRMREAVGDVDIDLTPVLAGRH